MDLDLYEFRRAGGQLAWTVPGVLSAAECAALIGRIEAAGPESAPVSTGRGFVQMPKVRNNGRVMFDDAALAQAVFEKVRPTLPPQFSGRAPVGANERFRCYRYLPGQYFRSHLDGCFTRDPAERSELTLMVYLNGDCEGGETAFDDLALEVKPAAGTALLFFHALRHEGREVRAGRKYVLRSDVMYRDPPR